MKTRQEAINLIRAVVLAEVTTVKQINSSRGLTKTAMRREEKAISELFIALTGERIEPKDIMDILP